VKEKKTKTIMKNLQKFFLEAEYDVFRVKEIARFGLISLAGALLIAFFKSLLTTNQWSWYWKLTSAYFIPPAGKESIIPIGLSQGIPPAIWGISIWSFDVLVCMGVLLNWWVIALALKYSKWVRKKTDKIRMRVEKIQEKKYGKYLPLLLLIFMIVPFQGSGAITTSVLGSWIGFNRKEVLITVSIGSFLSIMGIILAYYGIVDFLKP